MPDYSFLSGESNQNESTAKMIMNSFYTLSTKKCGVSAHDIANFLRSRYGNVWRVNTLVAKAHETLRRCSLQGFLEKRGDRYVMSEKRVGRVRRRGRPRVGQRRPLRQHRARAHTAARRRPIHRHHYLCDSCLHSK